MRLFINSLAATAGGGLTYIRNVIPYLATTPSLRVAVLAAPGIPQEFSNLANVEFMEREISTARRFWYEQFKLPRLLSSWGAEILLSAGNFALRDSPVPQILLSRNSIYTSPDFAHDLLSRRKYDMWLDTRIRGTFARKSIQWADVTVAPSEAFASELRRWSGTDNVVAIHHGFDLAAFTHDNRPLSQEIEEKLRGAKGALKLLFVSHYNYYRNFETLIRALPAIQEGLAGREVRLLLTCKLAPGANPGTYRPDRAARLVKELGLAEVVVELGAVPYRQLHHLYRQADIYVSPAYTETFAHPLVEAMSCGLPVIASDLPVHREICQDAAMYFPRFSYGDLAQRVLQLGRESQMASQLIASGRERSNQFSWEQHVQKVLAICEKLTRKNSMDLTNTGISETTYR